MKNFSPIQSILTLLFIVLSSQLSFSQITQTWVGSDWGDFNSAANWSPVGSPAGNDLIINWSGDPASHMRIGMFSSVTINSLTMTHSDTGVLRLYLQTYDLTITNDVTVNSSTQYYSYGCAIFQNSGNFTVEGDFNFGNLNGIGSEWYVADFTNPNFLTFKGDVTIGLNGRTVAGYEPDILFDGSGTQTVTLNNQGEFDGAHYFLSEDIQIGSATNSPTVVIAGTYQNSGLRQYNGTWLLMKENSTLVCNGATFDKFFTSGTWTMETGAKVQISGTFDFPAFYTTYTLDESSTTEYLGTNQSVTALSYGHLLFNGSGTKTSAGNFTIKGDFTSNTAWDDGNHNHTFSRANLQTISGTVDPTFYDLTINNTGADGLDMLVDVTVDAGLVLTDGRVNIELNILTVTDPTTTTISSYGTDDYINTGSDGLLRRYVNSTGSYDLPVGNSNGYQLANINLTAGGTMTYLDVNFDNLATGISGFPFNESGFVFSDILNNGGTSVGNGNANNGIWTISPNAGTATYDVSLYGRNHDNEGASRHTVVKRSFSGGSYGAWAALGTYSSSTLTTPITAVRTGLSGFSQFAIGLSNLFLPVELISFDGKCIGSSIELNWATASETNNDFYTIERSLDGINFEVVDYLDGAGNSNVVKHYSYQDQSPYSQSYYRIKQTDFNGDYEYSDIVFIKNCEGSQFDYVAYQQDNKVMVNIASTNEGLYSFEVLDLTGKIILSEEKEIYEGSNSIQLSPNIVSGIYLIKLTELDDQKSYTQKLTYTLR